MSSIRSNNHNMQPSRQRTKLGESLLEIVVRTRIILNHETVCMHGNNIN